MRILRVQGQELFDLAKEIVPNLVFEDESERAQYGLELERALQTSPESVMVIVTKDEKELKGVIIAQTCPEYIFISQFWSAPGNPWKVAETMFSRIVLWATVLNKPAIRGISNRNIEAGFRRFGFEEISKNVEYKIGPELLTSITLKVRETIHGKSVQVPETSDA